MNPPYKGTLGSILLSCGMITEDDVRAALEEQKRSGVRFGEALVSLGIVTQEDIEWGLSTQLGIPFVRLRREDIDPGAVSLVPPSLAWKHDLIPLLRIGDELKVAMADPLDREAIGAVERASGCTVTVSVALPGNIHEMLEEFCGPRERMVSFGFSSTLFPPAVISRIDADPTGEQLLESLLSFLVENGLTTITLLPTSEGMTVMGKKGGEPVDIGTLPLRSSPPLISLLRVKGMVRSRGEGRGEGSLEIPLEGRNTPFTVSTLETLHGTMATFRRGFSRTGHGEADPLSPAERELLRRLTEKPGIAVACGESPDGAARLLSLVLNLPHLRNRSMVVIGTGTSDLLPPRAVTIPPPPGGESPERLLQATLGHAPDLIVVEDGSDPRTFRGAVRCAMEGVLVILGYGGGYGTGFRHHLAWLKERYLPGPLFNGAVRGRTLRLLCRSCRLPVTLTADEAAAIHPLLPAGEYRRAPGCPDCHYSGHAGERFVLLPLPGEGSGTDGAPTGTGRELLLRGEISPEEFSMLLMDDERRS